MWPILKPTQFDAGMRPLTADETQAVAGGETKDGRKAGKGQQEYLVVTMSDVLISSF